MAQPGARPHSPSPAYPPPLAVPRSRCEAAFPSGAFDWRAWRRPTVRWMPGRDGRERSVLARGRPVTCRARHMPDRAASISPSMPGAPVLPEDMGCLRLTAGMPRPTGPASDTATWAMGAARLRGPGLGPCPGSRFPWNGSHGLQAEKGGTAPRAHGAVDANIKMTVWTNGKGRPRQRPRRPRGPRDVCKTCRRRFPPPGPGCSGIINPCATAAARRAGAGTLRTGYRGWSDCISAPSGTDALNHTISKYERMCTEE